MKIATLPLKWSNRFETTEENVSVQDGGDDFVFSSMDYYYDSEDFVSLTNNMLVERLAFCGAIKPVEFELSNALNQFLGIGLTFQL